MKQSPQPTVDYGPEMGCHLGWHFAVGCPLRGGRGKYKNNRDFCSTKNNSGKKKSFGQFKKHALLKARTQSPCFSYPGPAWAFKSTGLADLSSFGGVSVGWALGLLFCLPASDRAKMRPVYLQILALTDISAFFFWSKRCRILCVNAKKSSDLFWPS